MILKTADHGTDEEVKRIEYGDEELLGIKTLHALLLIPWIYAG